VNYQNADLQIDELVRIFGRRVLFDEPIEGAEATNTITRVVLGAIKRNAVSPEVTSAYECPQCSERGSFIGFDHHGWAGVTNSRAMMVPGGEIDLPCDKCSAESGADCSCEETYRQPFEVDAGGDVDYGIFTGGPRHASIDSYQEIRCAVCDTLVWMDPAEAITRAMRP